MNQKLLFILRQSPDWHGLAADFKQGHKIDPDRFRPPVPIPGFPGNIVQLISQWNREMKVDFFSCRSRLKEMCEDSIAQIPGAERISYRDIDAGIRDFADKVAFYHDDDDWFSPDMADILQEVLPERYDVCVFPLVRIATETSTMVRYSGKPVVVVGRPRGFTHRYQSNNYGLNGRSCDVETLLGMKDHVEGSEFANTHGLRDVYIDRIISATAKTPCSAQALSQIFRQPKQAKNRVRDYVSGLEALTIPAGLPWISARVAKLIELFSEATGQSGAVPPSRLGPVARALNVLRGKGGR